MKLPVLRVIPFQLLVPMAFLIIRGVAQIALTVVVTFCLPLPRMVTAHITRMMAVLFMTARSAVIPSSTTAEKLHTKKRVRLH